MVNTKMDYVRVCCSALPKLFTETGVGTDANRTPSPLLSNDFPPHFVPQLSVKHLSGQVHHRPPPPPYTLPPPPPPPAPRSNTHKQAGGRENLRGRESFGGGKVSGCTWLVE